MSQRDRTPPGITLVHKKACASKDGARCNCSPGYRAEAYDAVTNRRLYRTFDSKRAAENWRGDTQAALRAGTVRAVQGITVAEAWQLWITDAQAGVIKTRSGADYKPSVLRSYELAFTGRLLDEMGRRKLREVRGVHVQQLVDSMVKQGLAPQTVRNAVTALRVVFKWALRRELVTINPCVGVALPAGGSTRDRIVSPSEAVDLLGELPSGWDRALWATAFFAGLRRGELMGLTWEHVDLEARELRVVRAWHPETRQFVAPKSKKGYRTLGIPRLLVPFLSNLPRAYALVFGVASEPFDYHRVLVRSKRAWGDRNVGLHEARHTYASLMIAAGVNIKTISEWMGHSSITITLDRYGHLLPGSQQEALGLLDSYLERELVALT